MDIGSLIKLLVENKKLKATNDRELGEEVKGECGVVGSNIIGWYDNKLCWLNQDNTYFNVFIISDYALKMEWELIKEPVDFITAINSGKKIKGEGFVEYHLFDWYIRSNSLSLENINGNWYIED